MDISKYLGEYLTKIDEMLFSIINSVSGSNFLRKKVNRALKRIKDSQSELEHIKLIHKQIVNENIPLKIGVFGEFSSGKSQFINSLLGERLLGVDINPKTSRVSIIKYGNEIKFYGVRENEKYPLTKEEYDRLANNKNAQGELPNYDYFEVHYPSDVLRSIELIDTPGFLELYSKMDEITEKWMNKVDVEFWVVDGIQGIKKTSLDRLKKLSKDMHVVCILNKSDKLPPQKREKQKRYIMDNYGIKTVIIYSSKVILEHKEKEKKIDYIISKYLRTQLIKASNFILVVDSLKKHNQTPSISVKGLTQSGMVIGPDEIELTHYDEKLKNGIIDLMQQLKEIRKNYRETKLWRLRKDLDDWVNITREALIRFQRELLKHKNDDIENIQRRRKRVLQLLKPAEFEGTSMLQNNSIVLMEAPNKLINSLTRALKKLIESYELENIWGDMEKTFTNYEKTIKLCSTFADRNHYELFYKHIYEIIKSDYREKARLLQELVVIRYDELIDKVKKSLDLLNIIKEG